MEEKAAEKGKGARKSPRHHLSWPPCSYKKWLELTKTDEEDKGRDGPLVEESSEWPYHSQELDTLIPTTDDQSDTMHHLGNTLLGSLDDIKEDLKQHARMKLQLNSKELNLLKNFYPCFYTNCLGWFM